MRMYVCNQDDEVWWFSLGDKILQFLWIVVYQVSKRHMRPTKLSQALCVQIEICLIIPHMKGLVSTKCVIILTHWVPLSTMYPQAHGFSDFVISPQVS